MTKEELISIITDPDVVENVIYTINQGLKVPYPHTPESYFIGGHCNIYGEILVKAFGEEVAAAYQDMDKGHVVTKIGEDYFDANGYATHMVLNNKLLKLSMFELENLPDYGLGNHTKGVDDELIKEGIRIGKERLQEIINYRLNKQEENSKGTR